MTNSARIAFYLPCLAGGGAERVIVSLTNAMVRQGLPVDLVLSSKTGPYLTELDENVRLVDLSAPRVLASIWPLTRYLRTERPAALMSSLMHANVAAAIAFRMAGRPGRFIIREANSIGVQGARTSLKSMTKLRLARWAYRQADMLIGVSQGSLRMMFQALDLPAGTPSTVILNPVIDSKMLSRSMEDPKPEWPWNDNRPIVLGAGRLVPQKDFSTLIRAFAMVRQTCRSRLIILGEGEERQKLQDLAEELQIAEDLWMPGFVVNPFSHMRRASLYVLSSRWEGLPNTLIQAMGCGTPVVATRCPSGPDEILEDGKWGALVPVGDVDQMAQAMLSALNDRTALPAPEALLKYEAAHVTQQYLSVLLGPE